VIIIEEDMKLGTKRKVTFIEAYHNLLNTNGLTKVGLNCLLLSNVKILNERFAYQRQLTGWNLAEQANKK